MKTVPMKSFAGFLSLILLRPLSPAAESRPIIIFFLADDLGQMDIRAFNPKTF